MTTNRKAKRGRPVVADPETGLTPREREILDKLREGKKYAAIAELLGISEETVRTHVHHIYEKLKVPNRTLAVIKVFGMQ